MKVKIVQIDAVDLNSVEPCCDSMKFLLMSDDGPEWHVYMGGLPHLVWHDHNIWYCPFCGEKIEK